jgi:hypothetical protein
MPFQVSPGVNVTEIDLTTIVPAVATTDGAIAGLFNWGPVRERVLIDSEVNLASRFGNPTNLNPETWFTAASFLSYGNKLHVVRAAENTVFSAFANTDTVTANSLNTVLNQNDYILKDGTFDPGLLYLAKYPGAFGNSLKISVCDSEDAFTLTEDLVTANTTGSITISVGNTVARVSVSNTASGNLIEANTAAVTYQGDVAINDLVLVGNSFIGTQYLKISTIGSVQSNSSHRFFDITFTEPLQLHSDVNQNTYTRFWEYFNVVDSAPGTSDYVTQFGNSAAKDEMHIVVVDEGGKFTGAPGTILETYRSVSRATDAKTIDGGTNYYQTIINESSRYIWATNDRSGAESNTAVNILTASNNAVFNARFVGGSDGVNNEGNTSISSLATGYDLFVSPEDIDISLVLQGKARGGVHGEQLGNYIVDNIVEKRRDCVAFISPDKSDVVSNGNQDEANDIITFRNACRDTSYAVLDSGYKYMYDRYNDIYRWIPLNGDIAGLCVRTDTTNDPWFSPAGFNRGQIRNIVKLAYNPRKADRDQLYKSGINPVVSFPGQGTVLFGDKTLQAKPSAFDRINVRRLFIVLEKAISTASKFTLFEFNDAFTRSQFKNLITPYLRDVKGRRGVTDFLVVCDESNNTGEVIDRNEFIGDIYIKPARSINFIQLNFVAVRTGVQFSEVVGQF